MPRRLLVSCFLAVLVGSGGSALAQRTTGEIVGLVKDDTGGILAGVTVTLKGEKIVGARTAVSNTQGLYRFAALPPGTYTLVYAISGFTTVTRPSVKVDLGGTVEENIALKVSQMAEEVTVTGEAPVVDATSNQVSTTYDKDWVRNAPIRRFTFFDLINAAPGVNANTSTSSRSTSLGSATDENSYHLDGTDFTAPLTGAAWPWPNTDAIEEIEVLSLGAPAEYGNMQGAVFNVVTRQGSNQFHGDGNFYWQKQGLTSDNTNDIKLKDGSFADACPDDATKRCPYNRNKYVDSTWQLSGPIIKDKLWFFASYQYQRDHDSQPGTDPAFPAKFNADRVFGKLNWQINEKNKLQFAYHDDYYWIPSRPTAVQAPSSVSVEHGHNPSPNLTWTSVVSDKTYVEARISGFYGKDHADPLVDGEPRVQRRFNDLDTGLITGGIYLWYDGQSEKTAGSVKLSHFADNFLGGSHDFKFGVQYNTGGHDYLYGYNDYIYTYSGTPGYGYTQLPFHIGGHMRNVGVFADDAFRVNSRLTLNLGLRYDHSVASFPAFDIVDQAGNPTGQKSPEVSDLYSWNTVSPRIGFSWKLTSDGKTALKAHYGRYYSGIITGEFAAVSPSITPRYYFSGTYDAAGNPQGAEVVKDNTNLHVDPGFKAPYTDQFVAAFERELVQDLALSLSYTYKRGQRYGGWRDTGGIYALVPFVDDVGSEATGQVINVYQLQNDVSDRQFQLENRDGLSTRSHAGIVQLTKRMSHHWQMVASAVLAKATGRTQSSLLSPISGQSAHGGGTFGQNPNDLINTDGRLIGDRPFTGKLQFVYELPKGFLIGANFLHQSGRPWGRQVRVSSTAGIPTTILAEKLGDRRLPTWDVLDLRLQKEFHLKGQGNIAIFGDVLNLFNDNANENVGSRRADSAAFGDPTRFIFPRRLMIGAKLRF
jgi:Carboxypeptidase regulatory-like domain/TonB dependent receptor-like, beta-barrel